MDPAEGKVECIGNNKQPHGTVARQQGSQPRPCHGAPGQGTQELRSKSRFPHWLSMEEAGQAPAPGGKPPPRTGSAFMLPSRENPMATCYPRCAYITAQRAEPSGDASRGQAQGLTAGYSSSRESGYFFANSWNRIDFSVTKIRVPGFPRGRQGNQKSTRLRRNAITALRMIEV